jgi:NhaA family Na+:H+ antiporter
MANRSRTTFQRFLESETSGGLVLMASAALALAIANSPLAETYAQALHTKVGGLDVLHWINDGLMAIFFLLVGLEIKREMLEGQLDTWPRRALPLIAALGGMLVPALVFVAINFGDRGNWRGWAIPTATDIAFALGVLALLGSRVPNSLKVFLTSLAIIDDLGAIVIIATFYTENIALIALGAAALTAIALFGLNRAGVNRFAPYLLLGIALWVAMLFSGIHATLAGVVLAMAIPLNGEPDHGHSLLHSMERALSPWVAFIVLPIFGFANAGVALSATENASLLSPLSLGISLGLFLGKQIGIFAAVAIAKKTGLAALPRGASWREIYGVAILCGIGFTMSLFIGLLAFSDAERVAVTKLAVLAGSLLSALAGSIVLLLGRSPARKCPEPDA